MQAELQQTHGPKQSPEQPMKNSLANKKISCWLCKGDHFTSKCPYKDTLGMLDGVGMFFTPCGVGLSQWSFLPSLLVPSFACCPISFNRHPTSEWQDRPTPMADLPVACCWFVHRQIHAPFHACRCGGWAVLVTACSVQGVFSGYTYIHCALTVIYREDLPTLHVTNVSEDTMDNDLRELFSNLGHVA